MTEENAALNIYGAVNKQAIDDDDLQMLWNLGAAEYTSKPWRDRKSGIVKQNHRAYFSASKIIEVSMVEFETMHEAAQTDGILEQVEFYVDIKTRMMFANIRYSYRRYWKNGFNYAPAIMAIDECAKNILLTVPTIRIGRGLISQEVGR